MMSSSRIPSLAALASSSANGCAGLPVRPKVFSTSSRVMALPLTTANVSAVTVTGVEAGLNGRRRRGR